MDENRPEQNKSPIDEPPRELENKPGSVGPVVAIVVIVAVLILGGLYYWGVQLNKEEMTGEEIENLPDEGLESLETQGTSDTLGAIEEDLQTTDLDGLDSELDQIETELNNL